MDAATATLIGVAITGFIAIISTVINNWYQLRQLKVQWERDEKKNQIESEATRYRQVREQLQNIYAESVRILSEILIMINKESNYDPTSFSREITEKIGEAQKWLSMLVIYHYDRENDVFQKFYITYTSEFTEVNKLQMSAQYLRRCVIEFARNDPRLK